MTLIKIIKKGIIIAKKRSSNNNNSTDLPSFITLSTRTQSSTGYTVFFPCFVFAVTCTCTYHAVRRRRRKQLTLTATADAFYGVIHVRVYVEVEGKKLYYCVFLVINDGKSVELLLLELLFFSYNDPLFDDFD